MPSANVNLSDEIFDFLHRRQATTRQRSEIVSSIIARYRELIDRNTPDYSPANWERIYQALKWVRGNRPGVDAVDQTITFLVCQLRPDSELGRELLALPWEAKLAVIDRAEVYWASVAQNEANRE